MYRSGTGVSDKTLSGRDNSSSSHDGRQVTVTDITLSAIDNIRKPETTTLQTVYNITLSSIDNELSRRMITEMMR